MKMMTDAEIRQKLDAIKADYVKVGRELVDACHRFLLIHRGLLLAPSNGLKQGDPIEVKRGPSAATTISGYASVFNVVDLGQDLVVPGAFAETLTKHRRDGTAPAMFWSHNQDEPIGIWEEYYEDVRGLYVKGRLLPGVRRAAEAIELIEAGATTGLSIGFKVLESERDAKTGVRRLLKLWLPEISIVTLPMQTQARISGKELAGDDLRRAMDGLSRAASVFQNAMRS